MEQMRQSSKSMQHGRQPHEGRTGKVTYFTSCPSGTYSPQAQRKGKNIQSKKPALQAYVNESDYCKLKEEARRRGISMSKLVAQSVSSYKLDSKLPNLDKLKNIHATLNQLGNSLTHALEDADGAARDDLLAEIENSLMALKEEIKRI